MEINAKVTKEKIRILLFIFKWCIKIVIKLMAFDNLFVNHKIIDFIVIALKFCNKNISL